MATGIGESEFSPLRDGSIRSFASMHERISTSSAISIDTTDVEGEPPELTDRFLHDLLTSSNITRGHVKQLGLHLAVPDYEIARAIDSHPNDPALQAVTLYHYWHRNEEESDDPLTAWRKFKHTLKKIGLGRASKRMDRGGGRLQTDKALSREVVWSRVEQMTPHQARRFGLNLNLNQNAIERIMKEEDPGGPQALKMFNDWRTECELSDEPAIAVLNNAIENAYQNTLDKRSSKKQGLLSRSQQVRQNYGSLSDTDNDHDHDPPEFEIRPRFSCLKRNKKPIALLAILWSILVMAVAAAMTMGVFSLEDEHKSFPIFPGDIIKILLPGRLPSKIDIFLQGVNDYCTGQVTVLKDSEIEYFHKNMTDLDLNYTYLLPGSRIRISPKDLINMPKDRPYSIWLFDNIKTASKQMSIFHEASLIIDGRIKQHTCSHSADVQCYTMYNGSSTPVIFSISKPSYYFMRCEELPHNNCTHLRHRYYNITGYKFPDQPPKYSTVALDAQLDQPAILHIHPDYFPVDDLHNMTILAKLDDNCGSHHSKYFLNVRYMTAFHEYNVYLSMAIGFYLICLIIITLTIYKYCIHIQ